MHAEPEPVLVEAGLARVVLDLGAQACFSVGATAVRAAERAGGRARGAVGVPQEDCPWVPRGMPGWPKTGLLLPWRLFEAALSPCLPLSARRGYPQSLFLQFWPFWEFWVS